MRIQKIENTLFSCVVDNRFDILMLYLYILDQELVMITDIFWQDKTTDTKSQSIRSKERKKIRVELIIKKAYLEDDIEGLRVNGKIEDASFEEIKGRHLGIDISIGKKFLVKTNMERFQEYISKSDDRKNSVIVLAIDDREGCVSFVMERCHPIMEMHYSEGKLYESKNLGIEKTLKPLFNTAINEVIKNKSKLIVISSSILVNKIKRILDKTYKIPYLFVEGAYSGNYFGILEFIRSKEFRETAIGVEASYQSTQIDRLKRLIVNGDICYGLENVSTMLGKKTMNQIIMTTTFIFFILNNDVKLIKKVLLDSNILKIDKSIIHPDGELGKMITPLGGIITL